MSKKTGLFSDLKDQLLQLREIQQQAEKPYSQHVREVRELQQNRNREDISKVTSNKTDKPFYQKKNSGDATSKDTSLSQQLLSRSTSFTTANKTFSDNVELEALQKRYASTVRLLAESLEEQSNLRSVVELTSNPAEIDSILQNEDFRLAALGPFLSTNHSLTEEEEVSVLLRSTKIRAIMIEKETLLQQVSIAISNFPVQQLIRFNLIVDN